LISLRNVPRRIINKLKEVADKILIVIKGIKTEEVLLVFILVQPLFDLYMGTVRESLDVFGISIVTLLRIIIILTLFVIVLTKSIKNKTNIKLTKIMLAYLVLVISYAFIHHLNININGTYFMNNNLYNSNTEFLYVLRLVLPFILIYTIFLIKPKKETIIKSLIASAAIISIIIVITNIFNVSFSSYFTEKVFIEGNIFQWMNLIKEQVNYKMYTSKGLFVSANQMAALLSILGLIVVYNTCKRQNWFMYITLFFQTIAMIMIGTRTANYGWKLAFIVIFLIQITKLIRRKPIFLTKRTITVLMVILAMGIFFSEISPSRYRYFTKHFENDYENSIKQKELTEGYLSPEEVEYYIQNDEALFLHLKVIGAGYDINLIRKDFVEDYIKENYLMHFIPPIYIEQIYPYQDNPRFWIKMFKQPLSVKGDNRARQLLIIKEIKEKENKNILLDTLFGIGATPLNQREFMVEKDLVAHMYNLGIIGTLLLALPYMGIILYVLCDKITFKRKYNMSLITYNGTSESKIYIFSIILAYLIAYLAGHVIDEYILSIYMATITALLLITIYEKEVEDA